MKKYLGIIKIEKNYFSGFTRKIITKSYDDIKLIYKWFSLYPEYEHIVLNNTEELDNMFSCFNDLRPVSEEEIIEDQKIEKEVKMLIKEMKLDL